LTFLLYDAEGLLFSVTVYVVDCMLQLEKSEINVRLCFVLCSSGGCCRDDVTTVA